MKRIFIIDDDQLMCEVISRSLAKSGWETSRYLCAQDALRELAVAQPDLIVSDIKMPRMTGIEMLRSLRERGIGIPVILVTADPREETREEALALGVHHIFPKPLKNFEDLAHAVRAELGPDDAANSTRNLDELRLGLLTDLSHQLRTPVTAMKLAMEGLFSHLKGCPDVESKRLVEISRRNIDRIVLLVENQLELLQMTLGEITISRRLVDLKRLLATVSDSLFDGDRDSIAGLDDTGDGPHYVFTDPDALNTILSCMLCGGPPNARREMRVGYDERKRQYNIHARVSYFDDDNAESSGAHDPATVCGHLHVVPQLTRLDFEHRAYSAMLEEMGGHVMMEKDNNFKEVRISVPRVPLYDRNKDFLNPIRHLRRAAGGNRASVAFIKCEFDAHGDAPDPDALEQFYADCRAALSDGDYLLRGRQDGSFYLALLDRSREEQTRVHEYLTRCAAGSSMPLHISRPQTLMEDEQEVLRLVRGVEPV